MPIISFSKKINNKYTEEKPFFSKKNTQIHTNLTHLLDDCFLSIILIMNVILLYIIGYIQ